MHHPDKAQFTTPAARGFADVDTWVFDLDNTLYPSDSKVWPQVDERITLYIADLFGLDGISARALQKYFYHRYGTTLSALMVESRVDPHDFLDFAHDIDHSGIALNPDLGRAIERLPGRKLILTNGSRKHAENVARKIGILDHFEDIFDIVAADYVPKPASATYDKFASLHRITTNKAAMFEDLPRNLIVPRQLGMKTILILPSSDHHPLERWEIPDEEDDNIDYLTKDLAGFLRAVI